MYDYLIVGAGLFGATFAHEMTQKGKKCLVIDRREHIGGNVYCEKVNGINVHKYGAHIFHTSDEEIWKYVNQFASFNNYINSPIANYHGELYNMPFNMNTFTKLWPDVKTPEDARRKIEEQKSVLNGKEPQNLEEQAISLVGEDIYRKLVKEYTEKQWGRDCKELPPFIIKRLPVRFTFNNNYFNDRYQGIPEGCYNRLIDKMLNNTEVILSTDFNKDREKYRKMADKIIYTGKIDEYFDYKFGKLEYRTVRWDNEIKDTDNYQGNAVINYASKAVPYTRVIEHKHFEPYNKEIQEKKKTVVSYEYSEEWDENKEGYYPVNDEKNNELYKKYKELADKETNVLFGGRLAEYRYYDMKDIIENVFKQWGV